MQLTVVKSIGLVALFLSSLVFSFLPMLITRKVTTMLDPTRRLFYQRAMSLVSCFGGGVFLATCLLDLFPEVQEQMTGALNKLNSSSKFPCGEFVMVIGFFLVLIIEQVVLAHKERSGENQPLLGHSHIGSEELRPTLSRQSSTGSLEGFRNDQIIGYSVHEDPSSHSSLRTTLLVLALSLHSVFEGMAIGLQPDVSQILQVLVAVLIHKNIIAFTLGLNLVQSKLRIGLVIQSILLFSIMSPIGLGIGIAVINFDKGVEVYLISGILQGIACGTFLYVTFFEVLPHELNNGIDRLLKLFCVILGFALLSLLLLFLPG